jgi:glycosyltransferase involved in cell wall biosynthesis
MRHALPTYYPVGRLSALPPGCSIPSVIQRRLPSTSGGPLSLFYVGGVTPPLYDLKPIFDAVRNTDNVTLTICCREKEWAVHQAYYQPIDSGKIHVVHEQGKQLEHYYLQADVFIMAWNACHPYQKFSMPVKIFESLGYGLPIITTAGTDSARFVAQEDIGWVVRDTPDLCKLLPYLRDHVDAIEAKRKRAEEVRERHTWKARAQTVIDIMQSHRDAQQTGSQRER